MPKPEARDRTQALIARRDELLSPISAQLSGTSSGRSGTTRTGCSTCCAARPNWRGEALLGPEDLHLSTFTSAAQGHLADAFAAGTVFGGGAEGTTASGRGGRTGCSRPGPHGGDHVAPAHHRTASDAGEEVAERVGAAFREWRGERIERLVGDFAVQAFSAGVGRLLVSDGQVRWVMTSPTGCSDCDDNALAGAVPLADGFPTGHAYPPAHSGCRCLVAPADALDQDLSRRRTLGSPPCAPPRTSPHPARPARAGEPGGGSSGPSSSSSSCWPHCGRWPTSTPTASGSPRWGTTMCSPRCWW